MSALPVIAIALGFSRALAYFKWRVMQITQLPEHGWENNLQLANEHAELVISVDVGPRVLSYRAPGGSNVFKNYPEQLGRSGEDQWMIRGGHRLWIAPEHEERTYAPDNSPVKFELVQPGGAVLENEPVAPWGIRKRLEIAMSPHSSEVTLRHILINESDQPVEMASWALSVMAPGGLEIIPLPPLGQHPRDLQPNRQMIVWPYTDMSDERWRFGWRYITLRQTSWGVPTKLGLAHREKWVGYLMKDALFIKTFDFEDGENYPDLGCNFETFSNNEMLEIESLGPLRTVEPGGQTSHTEKWHLIGHVPQPHSLKQDDFEDWLQPLLSPLGL